MKVRFIFNDYSSKLEIHRLFYTKNNCNYNSKQKYFTITVHKIYRAIWLQE